MDEAEPETAEPVAQTSAGTRLRIAREAKGLSLPQISGETRVAERHLAALEEGDWDNLPGRTYAMGFARAYSRAVGLPEKDIIAQVKEELAEHGQVSGNRPGGNFEPADPSREPSSKLGWISAAALALLLVGGYVFYDRVLSPGAELPPVDAEELRAQAKARENAANAANTGETPADAATPSGPVVFTALQEGIWVKFYDASGTQLMQKQMARGERYTVPADADGPQIWTGRPDAMSISIGGRTIPKLAEEDQVMKDVPVDAQSLLARGQSDSPAPQESGAAATAG